MALTKCPECEGQVSAEAEACPHCGHPLRMSRSQGSIEITPKRWKAMMLIGSVIGIAGAIWIWAQVTSFANTVGQSGSTTGPGHLTLAIAIVVIGLALAVVGRFMAWWNHE